MACVRCLKPEPLCVCAVLRPVETRVFMLILQHPQEQDVALGTAQIAHLQLVNSRLCIGLSWPSLKAILGAEVDMKRWGVLYLGAVRQGQPTGEEIAVVGRGGEAVADADAILAALDGIILLDGSWAQAKALWWRNPWLLKARRLVLAPRTPSRYGKLRHEPRRDSLSTLEAAALCLARLEGEPALCDRLLEPFDVLLAAYKASRAPAASAAAPTLTHRGPAREDARTRRRSEGRAGGRGRGAGGRRGRRS